jgi:hypothetical protein
MKKVMASWPSLISLHNTLPIHKHTHIHIISKPIGFPWIPVTQELETIKKSFLNFAESLLHPVLSSGYFPVTPFPLREWLPYNYQSGWARMRGE